MKIQLVLAAAVAVAATSAAMATTSVSGSQAAPLSLGSFAAGSYNITATGLVDLTGPVGSGFTMRPDGIPDTPVTTPTYGYFNPNGSIIADGNPGVAPGFKIGSLVGSLVANPGPGDYFAIGYGTTVTLAAPGSIYALVNDTFAINNGGAFQVTVTSAVPEPASWAMMIAGFGLVGAARRQARRLRAA